MRYLLLVSAITLGLAFAGSIVPGPLQPAAAMDTRGGHI
jgi:hypothetical protein